MSGRTPDIWRVLVTRDAIAGTLTADECQCRPGKGPSLWCREHSHGAKDPETVARDILRGIGWGREFSADQLDTMAVMTVASALPDDDGEDA